MKRLRVKLTFKYSDIVRVNIEDDEDEKDAIRLALEECQEEYESFYDAEVMDEP